MQQDEPHDGSNCANIQWIDVLRFETLSLARRDLWQNDIAIFALVFNKSHLPGLYTLYDIYCIYPILVTLI